MNVQSSPPTHGIAMLSACWALGVLVVASVTACGPCPVDATRVAALEQRHQSELAFQHAEDVYDTLALARECGSDGAIIRRLETLEVLCLAETGNGLESVQALHAMATGELGHATLETYVSIAIATAGTDDLDALFKHLDRTDPELLEEVEDALWEWAEELRRSIPCPLGHSALCHWIGWTGYPNCRIMWSHDKAGWKDEL